MEGLLAWYDANKRDLPWRKDTDPYRVLVSEAMLQQTRVETVLRFYDAWLQRWPSIQELANAPEEEVLAAWSGLGYYRRARNLHAAAKRVADAGWPDELSSLPGVGPYTAAALGSIGFGKAHACVDGNVERVVSRLFDVDLDVTKAAGKKRIAEHAQDILDTARPGDWNQAMMELGATVCKPDPDCHACPLAGDCQALAAGTVADRPMRPPRKRARVEQVAFAYMERDGQIQLVQRPPGLLAGTWMLPESTADESIKTGHARHIFTHRIWEMTVHKVAPRNVAGGRWVALDALDEIGLSTAARKAIAVHRK